MSELGFIALSRALPNHPIVGFKGKYKSSEAWQWLLFEASYRDRTYMAGTVAVHLKRGELAHSTRYIARAWRWPATNVRRFLDRLKTGAMIGAATGAGITVISIRNYEFYQNAGNQTGSPDGAATGAKVAQRRRRKEQGNKVTDISLSETFSEWYATYPRKKARQDAWKSYCKLVSSGAISHADLMAKTRLFADHWNAKTTAARDPKREIGYCPYPASWLNSGEYADEIEAAPSQPTSNGLKIQAPTRDPNTFTDSEWLECLALFASGEWSTTHWGPKPGEPGCLVPAALLVRPVLKTAGGAQ